MAQTDSASAQGKTHKTSGVMQWWGWGEHEGDPNQAPRGTGEDPQAAVAG